VQKVVWEGGRSFVQRGTMVGNWNGVVWESIDKLCVEVEV